MTTHVRRVTTIGAALAAAILSLGPLAPALAAVEVEVVAPRGDGSVDVVLSVTEDCASGTTGLATTLPAGASVVTVAEPAGWSHDIGARDVVWSGPAVDPTTPARFTVTARLDVVPGDTVALPTVQACADGSAVAWSKGSDGSDAEAGGRPAPTFTATAPMVDPTARVAPEASAPSVAGPWTVTVLVVGFPVVVGVALGLRARRRRTRSPRGVSSARA